MHVSSQRLICMCIAAALLVGCGGQAQSEATPVAHATVIPTARIVATPTPGTIVIANPTATVPVPTATFEPIPATNIITVTQPVIGPGGLPYPLRLTQLNFGVVGHLYYTQRGEALNMTQQAGFDWFRQQIHWRDIEDKSSQYFWGDLDGIVEDAHAHNVMVMLSIVRSPTWYTADGSDGLPKDPATLARFVAAIADRYRDKVQAIEIWNEQNLAYENGGRVSLDDAGHYVEILKASYESIKAVNPAMIVVAGAPSSTATNDPGIAIPDQEYLRAMYTYGGGIMGNYFDIQAVHPGGSANPPDTLWPDNPSQAQGWTDNQTFYFRHIENTRQIMEIYGMGRHQVWITEFGWATQNDTPGFEFGQQISFDTQRDYIVGAMQRTFQQYPWVSNMFLWNLNFTILQRESGGDPLNEQGSFSILNSDWSPRPAFGAIQQFIAQAKAAQGR